MKNNSKALSDNDSMYQTAMELHHKNQLGAQFARTTLTLCLTTSLCLIVSLLLNGYLGWTVAHPPSNTLRHRKDE
ncbi:hypothetical protein [Candidatus Hamiltonella defensa]|uniref:hypothetical protein n=1 Tax=Candidatus Williamhamiltonella defendens TaxID=138072 RepID=UPI001F19D182|nr:hypothetical protein [Candidatus Hamiltonella defensa]